MSLAQGADRVTAAAWLGVLRAHQSRAEEALALLRPAARGQIGAEHTSATLHALLFTGHAHALAGGPALALAAFCRYTAEVERRQVPRFAGRAVNFAGWVLRNLGAGPEALDQHQQALEVGAAATAPPRSPSPRWRTWPSTAWTTGDPDGRGPGWPRRRRCCRATWCSAGGWRSSTSCSAPGWRCCAATPSGRTGRSRARSGTRAAALRVPRYTSAARLLAHRARHALGCRWTRPPSPPTWTRWSVGGHRGVVVDR